MEQVEESASVPAKGEEHFPIRVTTFYNFAPLTEEQLDRWEARFHEFSAATGLRGLIISSVEGLNSTVAGTDTAITELQALIRSIPGFENTVFKDSRALTNPFKRFKVKRRPEIVTLKRPDIAPKKTHHNHLSPAEWERVLREEDDFILIDTRNGYEVEVGKFKGALDPETHSFSEFQEFVEESGIPKEKKVLMYCTGGIRCEKAIFQMQESGYEKVYQLEGGILNYLKHYPNSMFEGECFVFDHRVAVDQDLLPSQTYRLCPHCGDPGSTPVTCPQCGKEAIVCSPCKELRHGTTCSKNCAHHHLR
ncbi:hypothetical protein MRY87_02730 [bacterium]|nr:hypothetical protein [bacterium]